MRLKNIVFLFDEQLKVTFKLSIYCWSAKVYTREIFQNLLSAKVSVRKNLYV